MFKRGILREHSRSFDLCKRVLDIFCFLLGAYIAHLFKFGFDRDIHKQYWILILIGLGLSYISFNIVLLYKSWRGISFFAECKAVFVAWFFPCIFLIFLTFIFKISEVYSREWIITWFIFSYILLILYRYILDKIQKFFRKIGYNKRSICLVSYGKYGKEIYNRIVNKPEFGFDISAVFSNKFEENPFSTNLLGTIPSSYKWLEKNDVDQLWISVPIEKIAIVKKLITVVKHKTVDIRYLPDLSSFNLMNHSISEIGDIPLVNLSVSPMEEGMNRFIKRFEDIIIGSFILLLISPLLFIISITIKLTSPGPIFYRQTRVGINNKPFTILKFRSMPIDVEKKSGAVWAKAGEKRATPFGRFLRKTSLDELPQFINVVKGQMSIVGPRPERPEFIEQFKNEIPAYMKKHMVKAGITGWAQINGWRGNTDLTKRIEHDIYYIENWSILFDIKIILQTVINGFINKNAY